MDYCLFRLTSEDYKEFRRAYSNLVYSVYDKNAMQYQFEKRVTQLALEKEMRTKTSFINDIESTGREMYFFKRNEENIGFIELTFHKGKCDIVEFFVFERYKGYGTKMWEETLKLVSERKPSRIELWTPYIGAQIFWQKKGFKHFYIGDIKCYRKRLKH